jgi:hypothetical protein
MACRESYLSLLINLQHCEALLIKWTKLRYNVTYINPKSVQSFVPILSAKYHLNPSEVITSMQYDDLLLTKWSYIR